jgi:hypothetical protein
MNKSLIITLDKDLDIYYWDQKLDLISSKVREGYSLKLSEDFEQIWASLYDKPTFDFKNINQIYLILGQNAGFTDSRIVFLWLKSWQFFGDSKNYFITQTAGQITRDNIENLVNQGIVNPMDLEYLKEPRIGVKIH